MAGELLLLVAEADPALSLTLCRFVSLAITTVETPASTEGSLPAMTHVVAIGMLIAERDPADRWQFSLRRHAIGAGDGEEQLFAWAARVMPATGIVIGWQLATRSLRRC